MALLIGALFGAGISWWYNYTPPPWLEINEIRAVYQVGSTDIVVTGEYHAHKVCSREEENIPPGEADPLEWRQEIRGTGPEIVQYALQPAPPVLELGTHRFEVHIPLEKGISPDGWKVSVLASCGGGRDVVRSRQVIVEFISPDEVEGNP